TLRHKLSGYVAIDNGVQVKKGYQSQIMGVSCKDDPDKARGKRGDILLFEEAGKFPGLVKAWTVSRPSVEQGAYTSGIQVCYGTGGTEDANYEGLQEIFYNPEAHNCLPFEHIWNEKRVGQQVGFFVPAQQNWEGYM